jgi:hypothetical protein
MMGIPHWTPAFGHSPNKQVVQSRRVTLLYRAGWPRPRSYEIRVVLITFSDNGGAPTVVRMRNRRNM